MTRRRPSLPGLGHGIGAALVGALAFCLRSALNLDALTTYMEAAVGISIMIIGVNGIAEAREWREDHEESFLLGAFRIFQSLSEVRQACFYHCGHIAAQLPAAAPGEGRGARAGYHQI